MIRLTIESDDFGDDLEIKLEYPEMFLVLFHVYFGFQVVNLRIMVSFVFLKLSAGNAVFPSFSIICCLGFHNSDFVEGSHTKMIVVH